MATQPPWASGPAEILKHGLELLKRDSDTNRRLAMISIDNAVELTIKTYLGLPKRVTSLKISRSEYQDFAESFPKLLDALEKYANSKLDGIDLGEIEWYHRLRNQLYHQGNGLTVERDKVEVYAELANVLFANLFGIRLVEPEDDGTALLGNFMLAWVNLEKSLTTAGDLLMSSAMRNRPVMIFEIARVLQGQGILSNSEIEEIQAIRKIRNEVVHGKLDHKDVLNREMIEKLTSLNVKIEQWLSTQRN